MTSTSPEGGDEAAADAADAAAADAADADVELLEEPPAVGPLIARAALPFGRRSRDAELPARRVMLTGAQVDVTRLADYTHLCGMTLQDRVPATYLHVLSFPLQVHLMAARDFPYPMAGMVHVANTMTLHRPVEVGETLTLSSAASNVRPHRRGITVDLLGRAEVGEETVWEGVSTYLVRGAEPPASDATADADDGAAAGSPPLSSWARWRLPADLGRRYAAVSGDVNPIHLNPLAAKAFAFPRAIAHGMWTHARVLGALEGRLADRHTVAVDFRKPVLLPSAVDFAAVGDDDGWRFAVNGKDGERVHLTGSVHAPGPRG